jgi:hypothetical protein
VKLKIHDLNVIPESCNGFMVYDEDSECVVYTCDTREEAERFVKGKQHLEKEN